ncbi:DctP family TRAP transporter solute-binding subunit [Thiomicrorhabdus sp. 6S3-12]|uniref:DctP family TRAP transporter solute-binding subunit n=1 Tax=Thiomicrorhabdus sp. 6S3-12 TaxID=2819681 RepID=UPI001AAC7464|nr:DctP family TRAP transporter solute-binding subunit [Thiomicrorhabdus sp. 6S3-12]MBO1923626.1 DctP family TRAP transporter solute-binding subunit [Thiomicrorhabdus sp. 6S3-12]
MRKFSIFVFIFIVIALLIGFEKNFLIPTPEKTPPSAMTIENEQIHLRFGHNTPENSALHLAALRFAEQVKQKTRNRVIIEVFPSQQLGNDHEMVEMAREGTLDILLTPTAKMSVPLPAMQYADLPFFFPSREDAYALLDGEPGRLLLDKLNQIDLVGVTFWENGFKHFTGNQPFLQPSDFTGKKIRVMKSRIIMDQFRALGAEPVPIDFHSTRQALADNVVDGEENPLVAIVSMGFHEVQSDLVLSEHAYLGYVFSISKKVFDNLPQDVRTVLIETAKEITPWERNETQRREQMLLEQIRKAGVQIHKLTAEQRQAFASKVSWIAKASEPVIGPEIISKTEEYLLNKYGPAPELKEQIVIGLDADLSLDGGVVGLSIKRGIELALDEINTAGGVLGKPLRLIARDHRMTASMGVRNLQYFIDRDDVVAVIGGKHSAVIMEELALINQARIPYLIPWAALSELTENNYADNYVFRIAVNDRLVSPFIAKYLLKHHKHPAIVVENTIWGRGNMQRISKYMNDKGVAPGVIITLNRGQGDLSNELKKITDAKCDSIILVADSNEAANFVTQLANHPSPLPVVSHWSIAGGDFYQRVHNVLPRIDLKFFQAYSTTNNRPELEALLSLYRQVYAVPKNKPINSPLATARAYDLTHLLALAITQAGRTDRSNVKLALEHLKPFNGAIKYYQQAFRPDNHDALSDNQYFMARFDDKGFIVPVSE